MQQIKFTKNECRSQQDRLNELQKYLPTLQLKKAMLQTEANEARLIVFTCEERYYELHQAHRHFEALKNENYSFDLEEATVIHEVHKYYENIAGIEVPHLKSISFKPLEYALLDTPPWVDALVIHLRELAEASVRIQIAKERKNALEAELRHVSIKVNLFEKILIPRALENIRKIKVFLGDQQLAAVSQAKVAKRKIEARKRHAY